MRFNCKSVVTDDEGFANITFPSSGTWHIWADGEYGKENTESVVSAPAYAAVEVSGEPEPTIVYGDVNGDGKVDSLDAMLIYACHNGKKALSEKQRLVADVNGDGKVDSFDAMLVYAYHNGKIKKFPIENK